MTKNRRLNKERWFKKRTVKCFDEVAACWVDKRKPETLLKVK